MLGVGVAVRGVGVGYLRGGPGAATGDGAPGASRPARDRAGGIIFGILDDGFDVTHPDLREPATCRTRLLALWDQNRRWNETSGARHVDAPPPGWVAAPGLPTAIRKVLSRLDEIGREAADGIDRNCGRFLREKRSTDHGLSDANKNAHDVGIQYSAERLSLNGCVTWVG